MIYKKCVFFFSCSRILYNNIPVVIQSKKKKLNTFTGSYILWTLYLATYRNKTEMHGSNHVTSVCMHGYTYSKHQYLAHKLTCYNKSTIHVGLQCLFL